MVAINEGLGYQPGVVVPQVYGTAQDMVILGKNLRS